MSHQSCGLTKPARTNPSGVSSNLLHVAGQVQDAKAAQGTAEAIAAACQRELSQVSSNLTSQLEAESMWQGRAQGLQWQLDQAMQEQLQLQQGMARREAVVGEGQHTIRCTWPLAHIRALALVTNTESQKRVVRPRKDEDMSAPARQCLLIYHLATLFLQHSNWHSDGQTWHTDSAAD